MRISCFITRPLMMLWRQPMLWPCQSALMSEECQQVQQLCCWTLVKFQASYAMNNSGTSVGGHVLWTLHPPLYSKRNQDILHLHTDWRRRWLSGRVEECTGIEPSFTPGRWNDCWWSLQMLRWFQPSLQCTSVRVWAILSSLQLAECKTWPLFLGVRMCLQLSYIKSKSFENALSSVCFTE